MDKRLIVFFLFFIGHASFTQERFEYTHQQMGTQIRLIFYTDEKLNADLVAKKAFRRIDELNQKLSDYERESELNRLCDHAKKDIVVSDDLYGILKSSVKISETTNGAFDITAGPLIRIWRKTLRTKKLPTKSQLKKAKGKVGFGLISFQDSNRVKLNKNGMQLDLGGIGKGYAADRIIRLLYANGITSALVDMGGDICVGDPPPDKENWLLALSFYNKEGKEIIKKIKLKNGAVATSGDLYQFVEIDGTRYSHIIDPFTGIALRTSVQVTTVAKTATEADAYASALSVLGIERTKIVLPQLNNIHAFIIEGGSKKYRSWASPRFNSYFEVE